MVKQKLRYVWILAVANEKSETRIGPVEKTGRSAIRDKLCTAGNSWDWISWRPDPEEIEKTSAGQLDLFEETPRWSLSELSQLFGG